MKYYEKIILIVLIYQCSLAFSQCDSSWTSYGNKCYKVFSIDNRGINWFDAQTTCQGLGANLASVHDTAEQAYVSDLLGAVSFEPTVYGVWIGLQRAAPHSPTWQWKDGTQFDFTNWVSGEPDDNMWNSTDGEACALMTWNSVNKNYWSDFPCTVDRADSYGIMGGFVCKKNPFSNNTCQQLLKIDGTFDDYFQSPNYPNNYPVNADACWTVELARNVDYIQWILVHFNTEPDYDVLNFYPTADASGPSFISYSGDHHDYEWGNASVHQYNTNFFSFKFTSDDSNTASGFAIFVYGSKCTHLYLDTTGSDLYITTPGYPTVNYADNLYICWTVEVSPTVNFIDWFLVDFDSELNHDNFTVYAKFDDTNSTTQIAIYSGSYTDQKGTANVQTSKTRFFTFDFKSDGRKGDKGFNVRFRGRASRKSSTGEEKSSQVGAQKHGGRNAVGNFLWNRVRGSLEKMNKD